MIQSLKPIIDIIILSCFIGYISNIKLEGGGIDINDSTTKESLNSLLSALEIINSRLSVLAAEAEFVAGSEDDRLFCLFGGMFYTAPALLVELVNKCHDEKYEIHPKIKELLEKHDLMTDDSIPPNVKKYLIGHFRITENNGVAMSG
jgi:hypothetical protein